MRLLGKALGFAVEEGEKLAAKKAKSLAVPRAATPEAQARRLAIKKAATEVQPLPKPKQPLALPKPAPKPKGKPKGGQWMPNEKLGAGDPHLAGFRVSDLGEDMPKTFRYGVTNPEGFAVTQRATPEDALRVARAHADKNAHPNLSPEYAAATTRGNAALVDWTPDDNLRVNLGLGEPEAPGPNQQLGDWFEKAYAKYLRNDFGTDNDPLSQLAARGLHYDPEMTPERWSDIADRYIQEDPIGYYMTPRHASSIAAEHAAGPDDLSTLNAFEVAEPQLRGALSQAAPWLRKQPATDMIYGIRGGGPEMSHFFDEMQNAMGDAGIPSDLAVRPESLSRMSFPQAVERVGRINQWRAAEMEKAQQGMLNHPAIALHKEYPENNPGGLRWVELRAPEAGPHLLDETDRALATMASPEAHSERYAQLQREKLGEVLKQEGDAMGHCVGGYCNDVMEGRSRIFSLRDAKGVPHVTIETAPNQAYALRGELGRDYGVDLDLGARAPEDIVQIKGKQNRAPNPEYLPFVQDFVKSGQWGRVGDLENTGLTRLPDDRYATEAQLRGLLDLYRDAGGTGSVLEPQHWSPEMWDALKPHTQGFKRGGLVVKRGCGCAKCNGGRA